MAPTVDLANVCALILLCDSGKEIVMPASLAGNLFEADRHFDSLELSRITLKKLALQVIGSSPPGRMCSQEPTIILCSYTLVRVTQTQKIEGKHRRRDG